MNKTNKEKLLVQMDEINEILKREDLSSDERERFEKTQSMIAGSLINTWLPVDLGNRIIMALLLIVGGIGVLPGNHYFLLTWVFLPLFSPRLVASILNFFSSQK